MSLNGRNPIAVEKKGNREGEGRGKGGRYALRQFHEKSFFGRILLQRGDAAVKILLGHFTVPLD